MYCEIEIRFDSCGSSHQKRSIKKMFLKTLQNYQGNTCDRGTQVFSSEFVKTLRTHFLQHTSGGRFCSCECELAQFYSEDLLFFSEFNFYRKKKLFFYCQSNLKALMLFPDLFH